jgi:nitrogen regulatory protein PII
MTFAPVARMSHRKGVVEAMTLLRAIVRPDKVDAVHAALDRIGVSGMTVAEISSGANDVTPEPRIAVDVIVARHLVPVVVRAIMGAAQTGEAGDGRILEIPLSNSYSIRTGKRDDPRLATLRFSD